MFFFDWQEGQSASSHPGIELNYSHGLILGNIEGVSHYDLLPFISSANELTLESATELFDALYQSPLESMGSVALSSVSSLAELMKGNRS